MSDTPPPTAEWLTYQQAGERLGLRPEAAAARARRGRWPKRIRNTDNAAEILVPGELLARGPRRPKECETPAPAAPTDAEVVQAAVAPLQVMVDVLIVDLKEARTVVDTLRVEVAAAQAQAAELRGAAAANTARIEDLKAAAERDTERAERDRQTLQRQADELSAAQAEAGKAASEALETQRQLEDTQDRLAKMMEDAQYRLAKMRSDFQDELAKPKRRRWWLF
jgi:hypothetical protein